MELEIWSGEWGLPSIDCQCLQVLTLLKISGAVFEVNKTNNPLFTTEGLPALKHEKRNLHNFHHILTYLNEKNYVPDPNLNAKELAESLAYRNMVEQKLFPALRYVWWVDEKNFENVTRPRYAKMLPFPLNFFYPGHYRRINESAIHSLYQHLETDTDIQIEIFKEAEKCLTCLSNRLGDKDFFFGSHPSTLDSFVFGCLAPLLKAPFTANVLQNHLKACPNLVKFVNRILQRYFSRELKEYEKEQPPKAKDTSKSEVFPNKTRNQILATLFAITAMLSFGISTGIFSISLHNSDPDDDDISDFVNEEQFSE
ncbi:hypothetical protein V9T40_009529 [Parthenolecanium corni]|uniref:Metaxin n=1 Tax=Parthenolecanium corni TaxID=536013 RepID=A0AAN9Y6T4_9HEMI